MRAFSLTVLMLGVLSGVSAISSPLVTADNLKKIREQGVPAEALDRLVRFYEQNQGREYKQQVYTCEGKAADNVRPCEDKKRTPGERTVQLKAHEYAVIIDYTQSSIKERMYLINWKTGKVQKNLVTHGKNSGDLFAYKFSNIKDSRQTSLGIYITGETYKGGYGDTLRMYGLQGANDQAYNRDIVMHGAWYATEAFAKRPNPKTKLPFNRLGVSWGCPAVALPLAKKIFPLLKEGAMIYHYHSELEEKAMSGRQVMGVNPESLQAPAEPQIETEESP